MRASGAPSSVTVIGAGIAGCLLANNLARRGKKVTVMDAKEGPGQGASGNSQGALYVKLGVNYSTETALALSSLLFSQAFYRPLARQLWFPTGVLQLAYDDKEQRRQVRFLENNVYPPEVVHAVSATQARALTGTELACGGLWFPASGWLKPAELCRHLLKHPNITTVWGHRVSRLSRQDGRWQVITDHPTLDSDHVVLCGGHETPALLPEPGYRMKAIRGQITQFSSAQLKPPRAVICGQRYLNPASDGFCLAGATFDLKDTTPAVTNHSHTENLTELEGMIADLWQQERPALEDLTGRVGFRCATHDYQPIAGELTDTRGNAMGITVFTGLGSKGLTLAPLLAEWLADCLSDQPEALPSELRSRVRPERCRLATG
ncbi:FAD-dependent 5-carboxymethylaminomethyl-2-thiouridine(34) oxidoreductase MnmC [Marinobacter sp. X15-166B]|uniref:FAD-dependent 5-carboxymethylaminomethyl-2-thiouridine(34) oxidoreductase MnmC n=1 Tax=Marinobacter sp. X15-166B TaxID=1897620 RepID=UPI001D177E71|nr:FAD-dependent 5-carboxymethylaminomethyl-2-thiouridine(34) oxidoreductase MnmC [Marinobacter sp. X15-166B]